MLCIARHGVTQGNVDRIQIGMGDVPLRPEGREQAHALAGRVARLPIREIWSSPVRRALETAEIVACECRLPIRIDEQVRELDPGPWTGLSESQIAQRFPSDFERWQSDPAAFELPGREPLPAALDRILAAVERIGNRQIGALIITHSDLIRLLRVHYAGQPLNSFAQFTPDHCQLFEIVRDAKGHELRAIVQ